MPRTTPSPLPSAHQAQSLPSERPGLPAATVAAVIERAGRFLMVIEQCEDGLRINQPAGHLEPGESLVDACVRETLEETAHPFVPEALVGIYLWRSGPPPAGRAYLRFAFTGSAGAAIAGRALDEGIVEAVWMSVDELAHRRAEHRSPLVMQCIDDYLRGRRYPIELLSTHPDALGGPR
jgi:8-oxo-dGTP pyrophosphatase MutT (NUDIX family)